MMRRTVLVAAGVAGLALGATTTASGYWMGEEAPAVTVEVDTLAAPGVAVATAGGDVTIDVLAPAAGPPPLAYTVAVGSQVVCTLDSPGKCVDPAGHGVQRDYVVTAHLGELWTAISTVSVVTGPAAGAATTKPLPAVTATAKRPAAEATVTGTPFSLATSPVYDDSGLVTPHVVGVVVSPAEPADSTPGRGDEIELTMDRPLDASSICGLWAPTALDAQALSGVIATLSMTADPAVAMVSLSTAEGECGSAGLTVGSLRVDGRYLLGGRSSSRQVVFAGSGLDISGDGLLVTVSLGAPDAPEQLRPLEDPAAPSFVVTERAPRDLAGLLVAPGVLTGIGSF